MKNFFPKKMHFNVLTHRNVMAVENLINAYLFDSQNQRVVIQNTEYPPSENSLVKFLLEQPMCVLLLSVSKLISLSQSMNTLFSSNHHFRDYYMIKILLLR